MGIFKIKEVKFYMKKNLVVVSMILTSSIVLNADAQLFSKKLSWSSVRGLSKIELFSKKAPKDCVYKKEPGSNDFVVTQVEDFELISASPQDEKGNDLSVLLEDYDVIQENNDLSESVDGFLILSPQDEKGNDLSSVDGLSAIDNNEDDEFFDALESAESDHQQIAEKVVDYTYQQLQGAQKQVDVANDTVVKIDQKLSNTKKLEEKVLSKLDSFPLTKKMFLAVISRVIKWEEEALEKANENHFSKIIAREASDEFYKNAKKILSTEKDLTLRDWSVVAEKYAPYDWSAILEEIQNDRLEHVIDKHLDEHQWMLYELFREPSSSVASTENKKSIMDEILETGKVITGISLVGGHLVLSHLEFRFVSLLPEPLGSVTNSFLSGELCKLQKMGLRLAGKFPGKTVGRMLDKTPFVKDKIVLKEWIVNMFDTYCQEYSVRKSVWSGFKSLKKA